MYFCISQSLNQFSYSYVLPFLLHVQPGHCPPSLLCPILPWPEPSSFFPMSSSSLVDSSAPKQHCAMIMHLFRLFVSRKLHLLVKTRICGVSTRSCKYSFFLNLKRCSKLSVCALPVVFSPSACTSNLINDNLIRYFVLLIWVEPMQSFKIYPPPPISFFD